MPNIIEHNIVKQSKAIKRKQCKQAIKQVKKDANSAKQSKAGLQKISQSTAEKSKSSKPLGNRTNSQVNSITSLVKHSN